MSNGLYRSPDPSDVTFSYVPYSPESNDITSCGIPQNYSASKEWADKKAVLFAVPGAFSPGCSARHLPPYIEKLDPIKEKGVDVVAVLAFNDAWVMSAWAKANGVKDEIVSTYSKKRRPVIIKVLALLVRSFGCI